jgi:hypothetical protein
MATTYAQREAARAAFRDIADVMLTLVRSEPGVPAGHLYAAVMPMMSLHVFEAIIGGLAKAGHIRKSNNCYFPHP